MLTRIRDAAGSITRNRDRHAAGAILVREREAANCPEGVTGNQQFFIGGNHHDAHAAGIRGDFTFLAPNFLVTDGVNFNPQFLEPFASLPPPTSKDPLRG